MKRKLLNFSYRFWVGALLGFSLSWEGGILCAQTNSASVFVNTKDIIVSDQLAHQEWLQAADERQLQANQDYVIKSQVEEQKFHDIFNMQTSQQIQSVYQRQVGDFASLSLENNLVKPEDDTFSASSTSLFSSEDVKSGRNQAVLQLIPLQNFSLSSNAHVEQDDNGVDTTLHNGTGVEALAKFESLKSQFKFDANLENNQPENQGDSTQTQALAAELRQPLNSLPLTLVLKGGYSETTDPSKRNFYQSSTPITEQALEWKPKESTLVKLGLRQEQTDELSGLTQQKSNAVFADFSHQLSSNLSWHTYAEYLRAHNQGGVTGSNGLGEGLAGGNSAPASAASSLQDESLALSFGPSFQLQKDISANFEFSNRWEKTPTAVGNAEEQRVSMSLKGTF